MRAHLSHLSAHQAVLALAALSIVCLLPALAIAQQQRAPARQDQPSAAGREVRQAQQSPQQTDQQADQLAAYFADKILLANHCEKELSKIAQERSQNAEVKQFAQALIDDHMRLDQHLAQIAPQAVARFAEHHRARAAGEPIQVRTSAEERAEHDVLTQLRAINHRAAQKNLALSKQLLEQYQGQDFDMAFLGMQIGAHAWLLSELEALEGVGPSEFQQFVASTSKQVEEHLERAQALSKKFEDDRVNARGNTNDRGKT